MLECSAIDMSELSPGGADGGADGTDGKDGMDGMQGNDGTDGTDGKDGADGTDGKDGADGTDGGDGTDGKDGKDGTPGTDSANFEPGKACTENDFAQFNNFKFWKGVENCSDKCDKQLDESKPKFVKCVGDCLANIVSKPCAECGAEWVYCGEESCDKECAFDANSSKCQNCLGDKCNPPMFECSGIMITVLDDGKPGG